MTRASAIALLVSVVVVVGTPVHAETGYDAWLRYAPVANADTLYQSLPRTIIVLGEGAMIRSARDELVRGLGKMLGARIAVASAIGTASVIVIGSASPLWHLALYYWL